MTTTEPITEDDALAAFLAALGEPGLEAYRQLVATCGVAWGFMEASNTLQLSGNDQQIFRLVAARLHRERMEALQIEEQPA